MPHIFSCVFFSERVIEPLKKYAYNAHTLQHLLEFFEMNRKWNTVKKKNYLHILIKMLIFLTRKNAIIFWFNVHLKLQLFYPQNCCVQS